MIALGLKYFGIAWMMSRDDESSHGSSKPEMYPGSAEILDLCRILRAARDPDLLLNLPKKMGAKYVVNFVNTLVPEKRPATKSLLLLDPDKGFEPEKSSSFHHLKFEDLRSVVSRLPASSLVTVYQNHRRKKFADDFAQIRERSGLRFVTAIHWHSVMFVAFANSEALLDKIRAANAAYARKHPVQILK